MRRQSHARKCHDTGDEHQGLRLRPRVARNDDLNHTGCLAHQQAIPNDEVRRPALGSLWANRDRRIQDELNDLCSKRPFQIRDFFVVASDIRLSPNSGAKAEIAGGPSRARPGHRAGHSITSSARASNWGGMVIPSALAVLRLITKWKRSACSIGSSAAFAPCNSLAT